MECIRQCKQIEEVLTYAFAPLKLSDLELRREQKAAFNAVTVSNTIPSLSDILPKDFVVHFVVKSEIDAFLLFVIFARDKKERV